MVKHKLQKIEKNIDINFLIDEIENANEEVSRVIIDDTPEDNKPDGDDIDKTRSELNWLKMVI